MRVIIKMPEAFTHKNRLASSHNVTNQGTALCQDESQLANVVDLPCTSQYNVLQAAVVTAQTRAGK